MNIRLSFLASSLLKGRGGDVYSRHITAHDRIVYEVFEDYLIVLVVTVEGHYRDK